MALALVLGAPPVLAGPAPVPPPALAPAAAVATVGTATAAAAAATPAPPIEVEIFVGEGCPHCGAAQAFVADLARERGNLALAITDVRTVPGAAERLRELARREGIAQPAVPAIRVGDALLVGFDAPATTGARIRELVDLQAAPSPRRGGLAGPACTPDAGPDCVAPPAATVALPFGERPIGVDDVGLPLFTVIVGLLDGLNPCAMWVLVLMTSLLAGMGDRRRMLAIAGTFVAIQGLVYYAFMAAWLNLFLLVGLSRASEIAIGGLALAAGAINLKDFVAFGRGVTLAIPERAKPGIYRRLRAILRAEALWPAMAGAAVLAVLVQLVELLCTSGFPALYTRILTRRGLDPAAYYGYLALYDAVYMADDLVVLGLGAVTLGGQRLQQREGRLLKLVAGIAMLALGAWLLAPR